MNYRLLFLVCLISLGLITRLPRVKKPKGKYFRQLFQKWQ